MPSEAGTELSGLARSSTDPGRFFAVDDGTGPGSVSVLDDAGALLATVAVDAGFDNAEALAVGSCDAGSCLFVADIGDNAERRDSVTLLVMREPSSTDTSVTATAWEYRYPDRPHNAESLIIDGGGAPIVITKPDGGDGPHLVFRGEPGGGQLAEVASLTPPAPRNPLRSLLSGVVATDASYDGSRVLLLTYDQVIEYRAPGSGADPATFPDWPHRELEFPSVAQAEGITGLADGCGYAIVSEAGPLRANATLTLVRCK